jgi:glucose-6-phosphate 1-epimerase
LGRLCYSIPIVFPQFGKATNPQHPYAKLPQHGFARISHWRYSKTLEDDEKCVSAQFSLESYDISLEHQAIFPYAFQLTYIVSLHRAAKGTGCTLSTELTIHNQEKSLNDGGRAIEGHALLHTYLRVPDLDQAAVAGLHGRHYLDTTGDKPVDRYQHETAILFGNELVDRVYAQVPLDPQRVRLLLGNGHAIVIDRSGGEDVGK